MGMRIREVLGGLYQKIDDEQKVFAAKMMAHDSEYVYQNAYKIDTITNLHELLKESMMGYNIEQLLVLAAMENVLEELFAKWLKTSDGYFEELSAMVLRELQERAEAMRIPA